MGSVLGATLEHHMIVERFNLEVLNYLVLKELIEFCSPSCKLLKTLEALDHQALQRRRPMLRYQLRGHQGLSQGGRLQLWKGLSRSFLISDDEVVDYLLEKRN
jgi:hypothetical protein